MNATGEEQDTSDERQHREGEGLIGSVVHWVRLLALIVTEEAG